MLVGIFKVQNLSQKNFSRSKPRTKIFSSKINCQKCLPQSQKMKIKLKILFQLWISLQEDNIAVLPCSQQSHSKKLVWRLRVVWPTKICAERKAITPLIMTLKRIPSPPIKSKNWTKSASVSANSTEISPTVKPSQKHNLLKATDTQASRPNPTLSTSEKTSSLILRLF
jgi:hypothetical protein